MAYGDVINTLASGTKNVTTAGTEVQLTTTSTPCSWVTVTARRANTGAIAVGDASVVAAAGSERALFVLGPGDSCVVPINNVNEVWIDSTVSGEGVSFGYGVG